MKPLDFIIFSIVYAQHFKEADRLVKQLLKDENNLGNSVDETLSVVFKQLGPLVLKEMFEAILLVSKSLVGHFIEGVHTTGAKLFKLGLVNFERDLKSQLVESLVELITDSHGPARDHCLDVLVDVCTRKPTLLVAFSANLKSLLDYVEFFSLEQIRKVYFLVSI